MSEGPAPLPAIESTLPDVEEAPRLPRGYRVAGVRAGIKASGNLDLALVVVDGPPAAVAATFTTNRLPAAPVQVNREHLRSSHPAGGGSAGWVTAMGSTSGCANAATGPAGLDDQRALMAVLADATGARADHVLAMSTGLIGTRLPVDRVSLAIRETDRERARHGRRALVRGRGSPADDRLAPEGSDGDVRAARRRRRARAGDGQRRRQGRRDRSTRAWRRCCRSC